MIDRPWLPLALAALACGAPASAATLQAVDAPPEVVHPRFDLHPHAGFDEVYDSNIFLLPQPVSSWVRTMSAGLRAPISVGQRGTLELSYDGAYRNYSYSNDASLKNAFIQAAEARYWYQGPTGARLRASETYLNTIDPANAELTGLLRRWANTARLEAAYEPEERRVHLGVDVQETRDKYVSDDPPVRLALDRYRQLFGARLGWQLQPKTVAYLSYHRELLHFTDHPDPSRDSKSHLLDFGVEGALAPKLTGRAQLGLIDRRYDAPPAPGQDTATRNLTALASLAWEPANRSRVELIFNRSLEESAYDINQFYIATSANLALTHRFPWDLLVRLDGALGWDKYPTTTQVGSVSVNRRDDVYETGVALEYPIRDWLKVSGSHRYRARFSRDLSAQFDYRDHVTTVSLSATY